MGVVDPSWKSLRNSSSVVKGVTTTAKLRDFDVIIVGSDTAGLTLALALGNLSLKVAVVGPPAHTPLRAPEILPLQARSVLQRLQVWRPFLAEHHHRALLQRGGANPLHSQTFIFDPEQRGGWTIDRRWFNAFLGREARRRGARIWPNNAVMGAPGQGELLVSTKKGPARLQARFIVDATGAPASYARRQGARREVLDRLTAVTVRFALDGPPSPPRVEPWADGWWYTDQRPNGQLLVSCMTDPTTVGPLGLTSLRKWWALLEQTHTTQQRVQGAWAESTPVVQPASFHRLQPVVGSDWLAVDEAAWGLHPLGGQGVLRALTSANQAELAIREHFEGASGLARYAHRVAGEYHRYGHALAGYYATEQTRWSNRSFWRERRALC